MELWFVPFPLRPALPAFFRSRNGLGTRQRLEDFNALDTLTLSSTEALGGRAKLQGTFGRGSPPSKMRAGEINGGRMTAAGSPA